MISRELRMKFYKMIYESKDISLFEALENSSCDDIFEIDISKNTFTEYYKIEGKFYVPSGHFSHTELFNFICEHLVHPDDREAFKEFFDWNNILIRLKHSEIPNFDFGHFRYKLQDGSYRYIEECVIAGEENGIKEGVVRGYILDIQNLVNRNIGDIGNEKNIDIDERNQLTGLLNEKYFFEKAKAMVEKYPKKKWCIIAIDIEHFKFFDEWYGRKPGNVLLAKIGATLSEGESFYKGIAGYFGQDDFAILTPFDKKTINKIYDRIRDVIASAGSTIVFTPTFGVALYEKDLSVSEVFDRAKITVLKAKFDITHRIRLYKPEMHTEVVNESQILDQFFDAFNNDEITFYLQPQCRISTGKIVGAESLARWIKKDGTIVPPNDYIPILEKYGFITNLDQRLWEKVCMWLRKCLDEGIEPVPVSVNVSRADIFSINIAKFFIELTKKYNIPHRLLKIEITESAYSENTGLIIKLAERLRKNGFLVLMDDFGSGYSSLNMLSNLKVDAIKLDANFLHIQNDAYHRGIHILESVVNMAKMMALPIIVEGVENQEQSDFLDGLGCRYVQGYHFYHPMPVDAFKQLLLNKDNIDTRGFVVKLNEQFRLREFLDTNIYSDTMLNNIIGSVAIYSYKKGEGTDIVRFNEQFYVSVGVPDFHERLSNIERFLPPEDIPLMHTAFEKAMENQLSGYTETLHFFKTDGTLTSYSIHFYYLGHKEGGDRFYGSANNVTELTDLKEEMELIAKYSKDNMIFVKKTYDKWVYNVASHGLADLFNLSPKELEEEMNNGRFAKRVINRDDLAKLMREGEELVKSKKNFRRVFVVLDKNKKERKIELSFTYVDDLTNNIVYVLNSRIID